MLATARSSVPGPRAPFVHIKVEDSTSGEDTDGEGGGGMGRRQPRAGKVTGRGRR